MSVSYAFDGEGFGVVDVGCDAEVFTFTVDDTDGCTCGESSVSAYRVYGVFDSAVGMFTEYNGAFLDGKEEMCETKFAT